MLQSPFVGGKITRNNEPEFSVQVPENQVAMGLRYLSEEVSETS